MCARYEAPQELWRLRHHERRIRLRPDAEPVGNAEGVAHPGFEVAANQPLPDRRADRARTRHHGRRYPAPHRHGTQGFDSRLIAPAAGYRCVIHGSPDFELTFPVAEDYQGLID